MKTIAYEEFLDACKSLDIQPNHLFACFRKTLAISQAKLAYILDTEGINQNTISKYEHKYIVTADVEHILWKWLVKELNKQHNKRSKSGRARFLAIYIGAFQLYILRYSDNKQAVVIQDLLTDAYRISFHA